ncbi:hypothetical protein KOM00_12915 [Geomonas sp. Red69]|uniref:hypothetical protein n=1 Tax=Geomonas diazotrophica TaxID=2843197 RepID=UPI001C10B720|nr:MULTISPECIES: hypothetical protein [Geomonas]MBU5637630.1 hypothetical protein [Geomonas diazotrophica]QXE88420.1 hypothetical protein KP003_08500 [Geomonas nitrogeniifigens]
MKKTILLFALVLFASASGCASREGSAVGGALGGAAVGVGAYEYSAHRQMQQVENDYKAGRINKKEYEIRKSQIEKGSLFQK